MTILKKLPDTFIDNGSDDLKEADLLVVMGSFLAISPCNTIPGGVGKDCVLVLKDSQDKLKRRDIFLVGDCQ